MNNIEALAKAALVGRRRAISRIFQDNLDEETRLQEEAEPDWPDRAAARESATVLQRLTEAERQELAQIDCALEKLAKGTYGCCEQCNAPIGRQRLRAIPEARFCILCTERMENDA